MGRSKPRLRLAAALLAAGAAWALAAPGAAATIQEPSAAAILPPAGPAGRWAPAGAPERYARESLYGFIDGGAELVLPYGFRELAVGRYASLDDRGAEITVEVYSLESERDAFGLFSVQRDGREDVSPAIGSPHWISPSQAGLAKGSYYVSITGFETAASDLEGLLKAVEARIPGPPAANRDARFDVLPAAGRAPRSERFIKGEGAARAETQFFSEPAWGFGLGATAVSGRYEPGGLKLIVVEVGSADPAGLDAAVRAQFEANLEGTEARGDGLKARNGAGLTFFYARRAGRAFLVWGKDADAAAALIGRAIL